MKRYGDNLPSNSSTDEPENGRDKNVTVMYGGCGVRFGTFSKPVEYPKKRKAFDILSVLGFKRDKAKEGID